ncbi:30S ribosomal protein S6e [Candidatus Pacearchaeota archaeon]|nr:30S ribosomal protein S6e [Candidatus Pacearchaeota archaeon]
MKVDIAIKDGKEKGRTVHLESNADLSGMKIGEMVKGDKVDSKLHGYELEIVGASDLAGFPYIKNVEGMNLRKQLMTSGKGMHTKGKGLRKKKSIRGNTLSQDTMQVNLVVKKHGGKSFEELFGPPKVKEKKQAVEKKEGEGAS